ncbi:MAG: iron-sulfur cluster assembly protein [Methanobrevibacter thaueri]|nr:iron-sulfur cluster assembly protein [Methanobrevibacter thaueri]
MSEDLVNEIKNAITPINDPHMGISIVEMGIVQNITVDGNQAEITLKPTNPGCMSITRIAADTKINAERVDGIEKAIITVEGHAMADSINEMINK